MDRFLVEPTSVVLRAERFSFENALGDLIYVQRELLGDRWAILRRTPEVEVVQGLRDGLGTIRAVYWHDKRKEWGTASPRYTWDEVCRIVDEIAELEGTR